MPTPLPPNGNPTAGITEQAAAVADTAAATDAQLKNLGDRIVQLAAQTNIANLALDGLGRGIEKAKTSAGDIGIGAINSQLERLNTSPLLNSTRQLSEIILDVTGMNANAIGQAQYGITSLAKDLADTSYEILHEYGAKEITLINGTKMRARALLGDAKEFLSSYRDAVLNDTRLFRAGVEGMTEELVENTRLATESLRMQPTEINEIFQRELSATGKISGEMLKTYEKTVLAVAQSTGEVPYKVAQDLASMTSDFNHFGALTIEQMGSLSATVHRLGLDISDVTRISDQFSSFDKAAQTMSNLAASTGATLDTLELFKLANTDQEQFIVSLRDQLESQGIEFENMNILQQKQIAGAFGIDPVTLQRLLNDNFDTIEGAKEDIQGRVRGMSDTDLETALVDMGDLVKKAQDLSSTKLADEIASLGSAAAEYAKTIESSVRSTVLITDKAVESMLGARDSSKKSLKDVQELLGKMNEEVVEAFSNRRVNVPRPQQPQQPAAMPPAPASTAATQPSIPAPAPAEATSPAAPAPASTAASSTAATASTATTTATTTQTTATAQSPAGSTTAYIPTNAETRAAAEKAGETLYGGVISPAAASQAAAPAKKDATPGVIPPAPPPATTPPQSFNLTLTIKGTDDFTNAIAANVVAAGLAGVNVGGSTVHLMTAEKTDASSVS